MSQGLTRKPCDVLAPASIDAATKRLNTRGRGAAWHTQRVRSKGKLIEGVESAASRSGFTLDAAQRALLDRLSILGADLDSSFLRRSSPRSLYIHGDAGRGKSWLADAFYAELPLTQKTRVHFHGFFDELHRKIHDHRAERDAVERAIDDITRDSRLLFFDELHVHDSGDARLLTRLLRHVFARRLPVLATSNYAPEDLLPNPIWHHIFEPGIALIEAHMDVWNLSGPVDYRTVKEEHEQGFAAGTWMVASPSTTPSHQIVTVKDRTFTVTSAHDDEIVATFSQLCLAAISTVEYLHWAQTFSRWVITDIPPFGTVEPEAQQRFINLIDVLVDSEVPVRFSSAVDLPEFIAAASKRPDAFRMTSRLQLLETTTRARR